MAASLFDLIAGVTGLLEMLLVDVTLDGVVDLGGFSSRLETDVSRFLLTGGLWVDEVEGALLVLLLGPGFTLTGAGTFVLFDLVPELRFSAMRQAGIHSSYLFERK